jgi:hypothetical protein
MHHSRSLRMTVLALCLLLPRILSGSTPPDEGMWTFDNPPSKLLKEKYGFIMTQEWLDHVRLSSVRFNDGGSGSFVSPNGLVLTNHHVARDQLQKMSSEKEDYVKNGFFARSRSEEIPCPDLELNVLLSMENVTAKVLGAVNSGMSDSAAFQARRAASAAIERESLKKTGLRSDVVNLYHGGEYWLYRYQRYTDVRLVFAPEAQAAFFGGDPDNFTYPRYDLDMALFRVYEDGKPLHSRDYLRWKKQGAADGELIFVSGNPGSTDRLRTVAQMAWMRDENHPWVLKVLKRLLSTYQKYSALGPEEARQAESEIFGLENSIKAYTGEYQGLLDPKIFAKLEGDEKDFRDRVDANPEWKAKYGDAWGVIAGAVEKQKEMLLPSRYRTLWSCPLVNTALRIVRYVAETAKPDGERLEGYHDAQLESLRYGLFSPAPVYRPLEEALLADQLQQALDELGESDPYVKAVLGGKTPGEAARAAIASTRVTDPAFRKELIEGGERVVVASPDPLIQFALRADPFLRAVRKWEETNVSSVIARASERLGKARFAVYGKSTYPDATFTLRLAYGTVKGYPMNGTEAPPRTTFYGLFDRAYGFSMESPFNIPERFWNGLSNLDLKTPLDFVCTADVVGGNSGSPVINRSGELVGLVFDGNIESLVGNMVYFQETNRTVAVHPAAMIEALRKLYQAGSLADELEGKE